MRFRLFYFAMIFRWFVLFSILFQSYEALECWTGQSIPASSDYPPRRINCSISDPEEICERILAIGIYTSKCNTPNRCQSDVGNQFYTVICCSAPLCNAPPGYQNSLEPPPVSVNLTVPEGGGNPINQTSTGYRNRVGLLSSFYHFVITMGMMTVVVWLCLTCICQTSKTK